MPTVTFLPAEISLEVEEGENLLRAAMLAGVHVNASCGGQGVCGKCRVIVESGQVEDGRSEKLSDEDYEAGYRLACKSTVSGDVQVRIPVESQIDNKVLNIQRPKPGAGLQIPELGADWLRERGLFEPPFAVRYVECEPPSATNNEDDLTRLLRHLKDQHDEGNLKMDFPVIQKLSDEMREDDFKVTVTLARPVREKDKSTLINVQAGDRSGSNFGLAVDVGTTTIFVQLLDLNSGAVLAEEGEYNAQIGYGEDVISRILYATTKPDGLKKMQELVVSTINSIITKLVDQTKVDPDDISHLTVAGNTTMTQLLLGVNPKYIRLSPYVPTASYYPPVKAAELGLAVGPQVSTLVFPAVASYVGGDIVAGVMGSGMYREEPLSLYIDLGTNGEIVVGNKEWLACAACSAGPAFEGGGIEHGMRATRGAIEDFSINPSTCEPMIMTIGLAKAKGICGSGIINTVAALFEAGLIDERGKFQPDLPTDRIREGESGWEYVLAWADDTQIGRDIFLTEVDIDNLIRAKGAMFAGYLTLLEGVGLSMGDLDRVIIAGGFGRYINLEKAITIGLMPELDLDKFTFVGNGSLLGARMISLSNPMRADVGDIVSRMTNFELSEVPAYMDYYMGSLFLPHTEQRHFPQVTERIKAMHELLGRTCEQAQAG
ncbi:MAG: DUF4445 domain-containing protein [Deltaproteobacteria bacterium]|nr:DUF4445 domain-containing protein [Deltaproteobacteria bacterium]